MTYAHITDGIAACPRSAFGRLPPVVIDSSSVLRRANQCKWLVR